MDCFDEVANTFFTCSSDSILTCFCGTYSSMNFLWSRWRFYCRLAWVAPSCYRYFDQTDVAPKCTIHHWKWQASLFADKIACVHSLSLSYVVVQDGLSWILVQVLVQKFCIITWYEIVGPFPYLAASHSSVLVPWHCSLFVAPEPPDDVVLGLNSISLQLLLSVSEHHADLPTHILHFIRESCNLVIRYSNLIGNPSVHDNLSNTWDRINW